MVTAVVEWFPLLSLLALIGAMLIKDDFRPTLGVLLVLITTYVVVHLGGNHLDWEHFLHITDAGIIAFLAGMMLIFWALEGDLYIFLKKTLFRGVKSLRDVAIRLALISGFLSALLDEVDAIILPVLIILSLWKKSEIDKEDAIKLTIISILAANSGSLMLQIGNPVSLIFGKHLHVTSLEHMLVMLPVGLLELGLVIWFIKRYLPNKELEIKEKEEEQLDLVGKLKLAIFFIIALLLIAKEEVAHLLSVNPENLMIALAWLGASLIVLLTAEEKKKRVLSEWGIEVHSLIGLWALLALSGFVRVYTPFGEILAKFIESTPFRDLTILGITSAITSHMDNVAAIAIAIAAMEHLKTIHWEALLGSVIAGNLTTIGSTANIVAISMLAKRGAEISYTRWLKEIAWFALLQLIIGFLFLKIWTAIVPLPH